MEFPVPGVRWDSYSKTSEGIRVGVVGIPGRGNQYVLAFSAGDSVLASTL